MRLSKKVLLPALAGSLLFSACGSIVSSSSGSAASSSQPAAATTDASSSALVKTASNSQLGGTILVNAQGLTLYRLSGEQNGKFICTSTTCLQNWHPLVVPAGKPSATVGSLGSSARTRASR
jgi:predicted lipoprotein with Yx(FWY)xxD motif